jgi:ABC-type uncharacterized transport system involved in gliding motility auxiliary subunit
VKGKLLLGILLLVALFLGVNLLAGNALRGARLDLSEGKVYTLTAGSKNIARGLKEPVTLTLFYSRAVGRGIPEVEAYAKRVRETLEEYQRAGGEKIALRVVDPQPSSEEEDLAMEYNLTPVPIDQRRSLYLGLVGTNTADGREVIPILDPSKDRFLEYDISRMISSLSTAKKPVVGIISPLQVMGGGVMDPMTRQPKQVWQYQVVTELKQLYEVRKLENDLAEIPADVTVLLLVHPKGLSEATRYAVDQFVLRGGRLIAFVDPLCENDEQGTIYDFSGRDSKLPGLLEAWGVSIPDGTLATDRDLAVSVTIGSRAQPESVPYICWLETKPEQMSREDAVTGLARMVRWISPGHIVALPAKEAAPRPTLTPIATTTDNAQTLTVEQLSYPPDPRKLFTSFVPGTSKLALAARLDGPCTTAFPDGPPKNPDGTPVAPAEKHLKAAGSEGVRIVLFADADIFTDGSWVQAQNFLGQRLVSRTADNGSVVIAGVDNMTGSSDLMQVRARRDVNRPFTLVERMQRNAQQSSMQEQERLKNKIEATQARIAELQKTKGGDASGGVVLSQEQKAELNKLTAEMVAGRRELRKVQRTLDQNIDKLGTTLRFVNIALVPGVLLLMLLALFLLRPRGRGVSPAEPAARSAAS